MSGAKTEEPTLEKDDDISDLEADLSIGSKRVANVISHLQ